MCFNSNKCFVNERMFIEIRENLSSLDFCSILSSSLTNYIHLLYKVTCSMLYISLGWERRWVNRGKEEPRSGEEIWYCAFRFRLGEALNLANKGLYNLRIALDLKFEVLWKWLGKVTFIFYQGWFHKGWGTWGLVEKALRTLKPKFQNICSAR